jgi:hypothetical protein
MIEHVTGYHPGDYSWYKNRSKNAHTMKDKSLPIENIVDITGLTEEEIEQA